MRTNSTLTAFGGEKAWLTLLDGLIFVWLYRLFPSILGAVTVIRPQIIIS